MVTFNRQFQNPTGGGGGFAVNYGQAQPQQLGYNDIISGLRSDSGSRRNAALNAYQDMGQKKFTNQLLMRSGMERGDLSPEAQRQLQLLTGKLNQGATGSFRGNLSAFEATAPMTSSYQREMSPYSQAGQSALDRQMALLGLKGVGAMRKAYEMNPAQQFAQEQAEKALIRNRAATGGLGDEGMSEALARLTSGLTSQNMQNQLSQLGVLSGRGMEAGGMMAGVEAQSAADALGLRTGESNARSSRNVAGSGTQRALSGLSMVSGALGLGSNIMNTGASLIPQMQSLGGGIAGMFGGQQTAYSNPLSVGGIGTTQATMRY